MRTMFDALGFMGSTSGAGAQEPHDNDDESLRKHYRTIFISDLHLGTSRTSKIKVLLLKMSVWRKILSRRCHQTSKH